MYVLIIGCKLLTEKDKHSILQGSNNISSNDKISGKMVMASMKGYAVYAIRPTL